MRITENRSNIGGNMASEKCDFSTNPEAEACGTSVSFQLAFSQLEMLVNRLWKASEPEPADFVYGRIWLHSLELVNRLNSVTVADVLASIEFADDQRIFGGSQTRREEVLLTTLQSAHKVNKGLGRIQTLRRVNDNNIDADINCGSETKFNSNIDEYWNVCASSTGSSGISPDRSSASSVNSRSSKMEHSASCDDLSLAFDETDSAGARTCDESTSNRFYTSPFDPRFGYFDAILTFKSIGNSGSSSSSCGSGSVSPCNTNNNSSSNADSIFNGDVLCEEAPSPTDVLSGGKTTPGDGDDTGRALLLRTESLLADSKLRHRSIARPGVDNGAVIKVRNQVVAALVSKDDTKEPDPVKASGSSESEMAAFSLLLARLCGGGEGCKVEEKVEKEVEMEERRSERSPTAKPPEFKYAEPGCLEVADILRLVRVPVEIPESDTSIVRLARTIHSDRVRLLWMIPAFPLLGKIPPPSTTNSLHLHSTTLFFPMWKSSGFRSTAGPIRRPLSVPRKARHSQAFAPSRGTIVGTGTAAVLSGRRSLSAISKQVCHNTADAIAGITCLGPVLYIDIFTTDGNASPVPSTDPHRTDVPQQRQQPAKVSVRPNHPSKSAAAEADFQCDGVLGTIDRQRVPGVIGAERNRGRGTGWKATGTDVAPATDWKRKDFDRAVGGTVSGKQWRQQQQQHSLMHHSLSDSDLCHSVTVQSTQDACVPPTRPAVGRSHVTDLAIDKAPRTNPEACQNDVIASLFQRAVRGEADLKKCQHGLKCATLENFSGADQTGILQDELESETHKKPNVASTTAGSKKPYWTPKHQANCQCPPFGPHRAGHRASGLLTPTDLRYGQVKGQGHRRLDNVTHDRSTAINLTSELSAVHQQVIQQQQQQQQHRQLSATYSHRHHSPSVMHNSPSPNCSPVPGGPRCQFAIPTSGAKTSTAASRCDSSRHLGMAGFRAPEQRRTAEGVFAGQVQHRQQVNPGLQDARLLPVSLIGVIVPSSNHPQQQPQQKLLTTVTRPQTAVSSSHQYQQQQKLIAGITAMLGSSRDLPPKACWSDTTTVNHPNKVASSGAAKTQATISKPFGKMHSASVGSRIRSNLQSARVGELSPIFHLPSLSERSNSTSAVAAQNSRPPAVVSVLTCSRPTQNSSPGTGFESAKGGKIEPSPGSAFSAFSAYSGRPTTVSVNVKQTGNEKSSFLLPKIIAAKSTNAESHVICGGNPANITSKPRKSGIAVPTWNGFPQYSGHSQSNLREFIVYSSTPGLMLK